MKVAFFWLGAAFIRGGRLFVILPRISHINLMYPNLWKRSMFITQNVLVWNFPLKNNLSHSTVQAHVVLLLKNCNFYTVLSFFFSCEVVGKSHANEKHASYWLYGVILRFFYYYLPIRKKKKRKRKALLIWPSNAFLFWL